MTVGGQAVVFTGRRLQDTSLEVTYEIAVADEAAIEEAEGVAAGLESLQADLAAALVSEVETSLEIEGMVVKVPEVDAKSPEEQVTTEASNVGWTILIWSFACMIVILVLGFGVYKWKYGRAPGTQPAQPAP
jgi:hypothetical protein